LLLSGAAVATQRSFVMTAVVLIGVMLDRPALTLRMIAVAALAVLMIAPEAVVHPSFQMSFAATLALVAAYERGLPWFSAVPETSLGARVALWGGREVLGLVLASLLAGLATTPYAAYHFHRLAPYGVIANLLAMPIVSIWVMPAGLLALLAMPFGFDGMVWRLMGEGIDWMIAVALFVSQLPGAVGRMAAFGVGPLLLCTAGLLVLGLLRTPLRFGGAALVLVAALWALRAPLPDILISSDARIVAVRNAEGRLSFMQRAADDFAVRDWLAADGDARTARDPTLGAGGTQCDASGCIARLPDKRIVALAFELDALDDDCRRAAVVATARVAPSGCAALIVDRPLSQAAGAVALYRDGASFIVTRSRPAGHDRPWARAATGGAETASAARPVGRDATPRTEDREAGD
jgi:competence protein ComEC